ncbi:glycosyltransferase [Puia sp. P3]|uniref:glycosyltransferase n=1 Tax=Puia sp. P3 TaxID=3423952 RepID=UPI003D667869
MYINHTNRQLEKIVIIPTYNEKENIVNILDAIFQLGQGFHILVIDDSSPDGTADIVRNYQSRVPGQLFLEERQGKLGLGTAYIHGFKLGGAEQLPVHFRDGRGFFP